MKTGRFTYEVSVAIELTNDELDLIRRCMIAHYDRRTKSAAEQGGFLYGWLNLLAMGIKPKDREIIVNFSQLDTCAKALEMSPQVESHNEISRRNDLLSDIAKLLQSINEETRVVTWNKIRCADRSHKNLSLEESAEKRKLEAKN